MRTYRPVDVGDHGSEHRVVEGERVLLWMRMDSIDAYQDPAGPIELSPYLHVDSLPETTLEPRRYRFTMSPHSDSYTRRRLDEFPVPHQ